MSLGVNVERKEDSIDIIETREREHLTRPKRCPLLDRSMQDSLQVAAFHNLRIYKVVFSYSTVR